MTLARGYAAFAANEKLAPFSFERRALNPGDVGIEIQFCGVCHSDIRQARGGRFPMVPGHEIAGVVTAVGAGVTRFKVGDPVGVGGFVDSGAGHGSRHVDLEQYMPGLVRTYNGVEADGETPTFGGYADHIVVKQDYVLSIPDNLPLDKAAPLLGAGIALYSPLNHWKAGPGKQVAIIGLGGLGHLGVKIARAMGAEVTVLSRSPSKREDGLRFGATGFYTTGDRETFHRLAGRFDLIINTAGVPFDWNDYLRLLKIDGTMTLVGVPDAPAPPIDALHLIGGRRTLAGSMTGSIQETQEMLDFCGENDLSADIERIDIQAINDAFERVVQGDVRYRFVIDMRSLSV